LPDFRRATVTWLLHVASVDGQGTLARR